MIDMNKADDLQLVNLYEAWIAAFAAVPINLPFTVYGKGLAARQKLIKEVETLISQAKQRKEQQQGRKEESLKIKLPLDILLDFKQQLEEEGGHNGILLDDVDLIDNMLLILVAGHETGIPPFIRHILTEKLLTVL